MAFADIPLPDVDAIERAWGIRLDAAEAVRLHGGEQSAAYRLGAHVVRVGPQWQSIDRMEWCHRIATAAAERVPEAVAPMPCAGGATVVRIAERPVSVWPFVDGEWADDEDDATWEQAAALLGRLHRALASVDVGPPPEDRTPLAEAPDLDDPELDEWLVRFEATHPHVQPQHGDYYRGNLLVRGGRIAALVDWDEAFVGPPQVGLANAVWEWCDGLWADDPSEDMAEFVDLYRAAGGTAPAITDDELRQLVRARLRREIRYSRANSPDPEYQARQLLLFERLRVPSGP